MAHLRQPRPTARRTRRSAAKRPIRQLRGGPQIQPAANHSRLGPDLDSAGSREARGYRAGRAAADRQHSFLQRRMLVRHVININAFAGCVLMVGVLAPGLAAGTKAAPHKQPGAAPCVVVTRGRAGEHGISRPRLYQRLAGIREAVDVVHAGTDPAQQGKVLTLSGLKQLMAASEGRPGPDAEVAFLRLVDAALGMAKAPKGANPRRLFRYVDFEAPQGNVANAPLQPHLTFVDSANNGGSEKQTWYLTFSARHWDEASGMRDARFAELLFPLNISGAGNHRRVQEVKIRLTPSHNPHDPAPPVLSIQSPTSPSTLAAVKDALREGFGVQID